MDAMLVIGNDKSAIDAAAKAIIEVLKHANDVSSVAAMNALTELARSPQHTTISGCSFVNDRAPTKRRTR